MILKSYLTMLLKQTKLILNIRKNTEYKEKDRQNALDKKINICCDYRTDSAKETFLIV